MISIIIPVYNLKSILEDCLSSVLSQSYSNYEVILIDDGSTDDSYSICNYYAKTHSNILCFRQENKGVSLAREYGVSLSRGEFITFVDGDDTLPQKALETLYSKMISGDYDITVCAYNKIDNKFRSTPFPNKVTGVFSSDEYLKILLLNHCIDGPCGKLFKRELFISGDFVFAKGITNNEDFIMNFSLAINARKVVISNDIVYYYHKRENSASSKYMNFDKWIELFLIIEGKITNNNKKFLLNDFIHFKLHRLRGIYTRNKQIFLLHKEWIREIIQQALKLNDLSNSERDIVFLLQYSKGNFVIDFIFKLKRKIFKTFKIEY